jgi:hypothetical protein
METVKRIAGATGQGNIEKSPNITAGEYPLLAINAVKLKKNRTGIDFFIVEFMVLESLVEEIPSGTKCQWVINMSHDPSPDNVMSFLMAATNSTADEIGEKEIELILAEHNPCYGLLVRCSAWQHISQKTGNPYTRIKWTAVSEELQAQSVDLRKQAGFAVY